VVVRERESGAGVLRGFWEEKSLLGAEKRGTARRRGSQSRRLLVSKLSEFS